MTLCTRIAVGIGIVLLGTGVWLALTRAPFPAAVGPIIMGLILTVGVIYDGYRYKRLGEGNPGPGWERTTERFVDPESGHLVTVYYNPATGERTYVRDLSPKS